MRRSVTNIIRYLVAVLALLNPLTAVVLLGYVYRRQEALLVSLYGDSAYEAPSWFRSSGEMPQASFAQRNFGGLWDNLKTGFSGTLALGVIVLPVSLLMAVSWYAGWNNSFNKGYEYAPVGPLLGIAGVVLGMITMSYLTIAQARHAYTGDWHSVFALRANLAMVSAQPLWFPLLPVLGGVAAGVLLLCRGFPVFAFNVPAFHDFDNASGFLIRWSFFWGLIFVPVYFAMKSVAARLYARSVGQAIYKGNLTLADLYPAEVVFSSTPVKAPYRQLPGVVTLAISVLCWFPVFALQYVQQFLNNLGTWGWLNQPLAWLPLLYYSP
jgi:hypothetical protein